MALVIDFGSQYNNLSNIKGFFIFQSVMERMGLDEDVIIKGKIHL